MMGWQLQLNGFVDVSVLKPIPILKFSQRYIFRKFDVNVQCVAELYNQTFEECRPQYLDLYQRFFITNNDFNPKNCKQHHLCCSFFFSLWKNNGIYFNICFISLIGFSYRLKHLRLGDFSSFKLKSWHSLYNR